MILKQTRETEYNHMNCSEMAHNRIYRVAIKSGNIDNIMLFFLQIEDVLDERQSYYAYLPMFPDFMATLY
jgi:hypothetical protein